MLKPHRNHPSYRAHLGHRLSGLALALFLPFHFLLLGLAVEAAALDAALAWTELLLFKLAEWGLVTLLALHLTFGLRVLALELLPWPGGKPRPGWILPGLAAAVVVGVVFLAGAL
jgi:fumarate reductase subunit D